MKTLFINGIIDINLHLFEDVVNTTSSPNIAAEQPDNFWENKIIFTANKNLVYNQFGDSYPIPANNGKTVEMRIFNPYPIAGKISETALPDAQAMSISSITATIDQYGAYTKISDLADWTSKDNLNNINAQGLSDQAARTIDTITREIVVGGSNVLYAPSIAADGAITPVTSRSSITPNCKINAKLLFRAAAILKAADAPKFEGGYGGVVHPIVAGDLMQDEKNFVDRIKYAAPERFLNGEVGKIADVRVVESSNAKIFAPANILKGVCRLTVKTTNASAATAIPVNEAITAEEASTLIAGGVDVYINGVANKATAVTAGAAGSASITVNSAVAVTAGHIICGTGAGKDGSAVYGTMIFGQHSFGTTQLEKGGLKFITKSADEIGGALAQFSTAGFKLTWVAKRLQEANMLRVESGSDDSLTAEAN